MDIGDIKTVVALWTKVTIVDMNGDRLYAGKAEDIPHTLFDMSVEGLEPCYDYNRDEVYLWIEVL